MGLAALGFRLSGRHLPVMSEAAWAELVAGAVVLARDRRGDETLRTRDGRDVVKVFGPKRVLSSALWSPYALRFVDNAAALAARGIAGPEVTGLWRREGGERHVVTYRWREGIELREALAGPDAARHAAELGRFLARLHAAGVFFRTLHLGNVLVGPDGLSLIDVVDARCGRAPVHPSKRGKDVFYCCCAHPEDGAALERHAPAFVRAYFEASELAMEDRVSSWVAFPCAVTSLSGRDWPPAPGEAWTAESA